MSRGLLANHCGEIVKIVSSLSSTPPTDHEGLRRRFTDLINDFQTAAARSGYSHEVLEQAQYALVALIDERVMSLEGEIRERWLAAPLQMQFFSSFNAGEEFYQRLAPLRNPSTPERADTLEVFHLALCLGFRGKHADPSAEPVRRQLIEQISGEIRSARGGINVPLSPAALCDGSAPARSDLLRWLGMPIWMTPVLVVAIVLLWWLATDLITGAAVDRIVRLFPIH